ncbi:major facilitator family protein [Chrysochromulina tobinii]|uniref:Major facilitator family protein n=1 Tax=Chrysochromulina tobinii TaxID=1460289 RepID=A0A0M0JQW5_9EUKA|nr:major facilitator family protein [Chrysochromulina tobinii]|eukprot:KOO28702.1 major facilitator family protein [Chrysochromulina sp. CCMP291]
MRIPMRSMAARQLHVERQLQTGPAVPTQISAVTANLLDELKYLEETDLRVRFDEFDANRDGIIDIDEAHNHLLSTGRCCCAEDTKAAARHVVEALDGDGDGRVSWDEFKLAATPAVDARVRPIYATLILTFVAQGIQFPVLPQLARSLSLSTADLGLVSASTSLARMVCNVPAALLAERLGRRPLLIAGPAVSGIGMLGLACASSFEHLVLSNIAIGAGMASAMAGASNYLADISMPRNRAQTTAPLLQSALIGFAIGPAVGGVLCQYTGLSWPFVACAAGLAASSVTGALLLPETLDEASVRAMVQDGGALLGAAGAGAVAGAYGVPTAIEMVAALQVASTIFCALRSPWKHSKRD